LIHVGSWLLSLWLILSLPAIAQAGSPIAVEVDVLQKNLTVGEPLVIEMRVKNISVEPLPTFGLYSSAFSLTSYQGDVVEGCKLEIYSVDPPGPVPPPPPLFGFAWFIDDLQPDQTVTCQVTYPHTLYVGDETIYLLSFFNSVEREEAEFTYTLVPQSAPPQPVPSDSPAWLSFLGLALLLCGLRRLCTVGRA
jgi:hypothetical protein